VFDTLLLLVENSGHVLGKSYLMEALWPDSFVEESSLAQNISLLRRALAEAGGGGHYIETLSKRGYRFVVDVYEIKESDAELVMNERTTGEVVEEEKQPADDMRLLVQSNPYHESGRSRRRAKSYFAASSIFIVALASIIYFFERGKRAQDFAPRSIAVLPFEIIGKNSDAELLDLGVVDALVMSLSGSNQPTVLPASSVFKYANHEKDTVTIGKELGVDAVLDGTLQRYGDSIRVSAQLIMLRDGKTIWSEKFDEPYRGLFAAQDSISARLTNDLLSQLPQAGSQRRLNRTTHDEEAYQAYLTGLYFWSRRTRENLGKAIDYLEQAVKKDPNFAPAHAVLADSYYVCASSNWNVFPIDEEYVKARAHANQALELDDGIAEAHTVKAGLLVTDHNYEEAEREFRRALELNPGYAAGHLRYGYFLFGEMKLNEALAEMKRAQELDPVSPIANLALGYMQFMSRDFDAAIKSFSRTLELQPDLVDVHINLGEAYVYKRMFKEARTEFEALKDDQPSNFAIEMIGLYGAAGSHEQALRMLLQLKDSRDRDQIGPYQYATVYAALNDKDAAFAWLDKMTASRSDVTVAKLDPAIDNLKDDPRFGAWLKRHEN
jgi:TolB-like protein/DNA-binding winged helix-turn-helix (wHTH) protein/Tfp pilus assembly protein PilF